MRSRVGFAASLIAVGLLAACTAAPTPSSTPSSGPSTAPTALDTLQPSPTSTSVVGVRAPRGVLTRATIVGEIWLGFEACVGLTPNGQSPYLPPLGQDDFVLVFPKGWRILPDHPTEPLFGDHFRILDGDGGTIAEDGDVLEARGQLRATEATHCGFGWPISVREVERVGG